MDAQIKARWIAALRDPEARQYRERLGSFSGGRCCLGVLCDLAVQDGIIDPPTTDDAGDLRYADEDVELPEPVIAWAGLDSLVETDQPNPRVQGEHLATWNDDYRKTFPEIADMIEASDL